MSTTPLGSTAPTLPPVVESNATVFIVDDEKALRLVLCRAMEKEGYHTIEVDSGERCLFLCQQQLPDLILLDAVMPGMDGFQCCKQLRTNLGDRCPDILMITALHDQESVDKAFTAGASDFITKPIHWAVLRQGVQRVLKNSLLRTQWQESLIRVQQLQEQLAVATQQVEYLTELCRSNGISKPCPRPEL